MTSRIKCVHCGYAIEARLGNWVHESSGSVWCDESGTIRAVPSQ